MKFFGRFAVLLFVIAAIVAPGVLAQNAPLGIVAQPSDLTVTVATDKAGYAIGEKVRITGALNQSAYLYIVDVDAANKASLAFPNAFSPVNQRAAGGYSLPDKIGYNFTVVPPSGTEYLYAIASTQPLNLDLLFSAANPFASLGNPQQATALIQGALKALAPNAKSAVAFTSFQVLSPGQTLPTNPLGQITAQAQSILPSDPRFGMLAAQFYVTLGMNEQAVAQKLQANAAAQSIFPQLSQGAQFALLPEAQNVDLNQAVLQQGQTLLLGTLTLPTNAAIGGTLLSAGTYGVGVMNGAAAGMMTDSASGSAIFGGFVIVLIDLSTGNCVAFIYFPVVSFFPLFFPVFSPIYVFQIVLQITIVTPVFFPFPFPFFPTPGLSCSGLPNVTPFSVTLGGPFDTILSTPKFTVTELGIGPNGGTLVKVQSLGYATAVQSATVFTSKYVTLAPFGNVTFEVISSPTFVLQVESAGQMGCVQATRNGFTLSGQSAHN
ncbi:DUF4384 domain-containing protein [Candidatus Acetothermia bacterium]|nr:DUF4384 domain-containing protein [Candidatus Acetothermia bacterium]